MNKVQIISVVLLACSILISYGQHPDFTFEYDDFGNRTDRIFHGIQPAPPQPLTSYNEEGIEEENTTKKMEVVELSTEPLAEELTSGNIMIYPNPSPGYFKVYLPLQEEGMARITLFDFAGKQVFQTTTNQHQNVIDIRHRVSGTYILKIEMEGGPVMHRIVKEE